MDHTGKVVWITGASSGIGEALAHAYSRRGAQLVLSARSAAKLEQVRNACADPEKHRVVPLDLSQPASIEQACGQVLGGGGRVDILLNNGGISQRSLAAEATLDVDRAIMETNFFGTVALTKAVLPSMLERGSGHIVVVSSLVGIIGTPFRSSYAASKHALHGFFDSLRAETWKQGIRVTMACPGFIRTDISVKALSKDGTPHGTMDDALARGMPPATCAEKIVRAVEQNRDEVYIGGKEVLGVYLKRYFPALFNRIIRKAKVT